MAATQAYRDWVRAGRPYTLIRPARALQTSLRAHGLTVYDYPDPGHLQAATPEDHTPYSATGWPGKNQRWNARGLDIMPRSDSSAHRKENADIARQLIRDRDAGIPDVMWIKYLNWTDEDGACRREAWKDATHPLRRTTSPSSDRGHIHVSGRSDADDDTRADGYDPIARMSIGAAMTDFGFSQKVFGDSAAWRLDAIVKGLDKVAGGPSAGEGVWLVKVLSGLEAAAVADAQRDQAANVAINGLVAAVEAGGGSIDAAAIVAAVTAARDQTHADMLLLQQNLAESREREIALQKELAAVRAAAEANLSPAERSGLGT